MFGDEMMMDSSIDRHHSSSHRETFRVMSRTLVLLLLLFVCIGFSRSEPILLSPCRIREHSPIGELIVTLPKSNSSYRFVNANHRGVQEYFTLNSSTGQIHLRADLDREVICPHRRVQCQFILKIFELFDETLYHLPILIEDINDHRPKFPYSTSPIELHLSEHSPPEQSKLFLQPAYDEDQIDQEYPLEYHLNATNKSFPFRFQIDQDELTDRLVFVLIESLDRETIDVYHCTLTVIDTAGHREDLAIRIIVDDVNDHSPVFERQAYLIDVSEKTPVNRTIVHVHANDADAGRNGRITYELTDASKEFTSIFFIDSNTGLIRLRSPLDYEQRSSYLFYLIARDSGEDRRSSQTLINITVLNENDCAPTIDIRFLSEMNFNPQLNRLDLSESYPIEKFFAQIIVIDPDYPLTGRTSLWFETNRNETCFHLYSIDRSTYLFNRSTSFDFESEEFYQITFYAEDSDPDQPLQSNRTLFIQIHDENDHRPEFLQSDFHFSLKENNPLNFTITRIEAFDRDSGENGRIHYAILSNESTLPFYIDPQSGLLLALQSLDYEERSHYSFEILAFDHGSPYRYSSKISVSIDLIDVNDHPPRFRAEQYFFSIPEDYPRWKSFGHVQAEDADGHSHLIYRLNENRTFQIDGRGRLFLVRSIDREERDRHELIVIVSDQHFQTSVPVLISIFDVNDCAPEWIFPRKNFSMIEINRDFFTPGMTLFQLQTLDRDDLNNGNGLVTYTIHDPYHLFFVNPRGDFIMNVTPMIGRYSLRVTAKDHGQTIQLMSSIEFHLFVGDNQTNGSSFTDEFYSFNSLSTTKRLLLLSTLLISVAFLLIFLISLLVILICRYRKDKTFLYRPCHPPEVLVIENQSNSSKTTLDDLFHPSASSSPSFIDESNENPSVPNPKDQWRIEKLLYPNWLYDESEHCTSTFHHSPKHVRFQTSPENRCVRPLARTSTSTVLINEQLHQTFI